MNQVDQIEQLVDIISMKNNLQRKYLINWRENIKGLEIKFDTTIRFFNSRGYSLEEIAEAYLFMCNLFLIDNKYFVEYGKYRYSTLAEAEKYVYSNAEVMNKYMLGLSISTYLWHQHREMMKFFIRVCQEISTRKGRYLEIGPGHGEYFVTAIQNTTFDYYCAVDISETSVNITKDFCDFSLPGYNGLVEILKADFFEFNCEDKFDAIVMGEVLEHVENPYQFLKKIYDIANEGAYIYISTAVNAPQPDHIYHFKNLDEVYFLLNKARLKIKNQVLIPANANSLDKAIKKGYAIVVGLALEKL